MNKINKRNVIAKDYVLDPVCFARHLRNVNKQT